MKTRSCSLPTAIQVVLQDDCRSGGVQPGFAFPPVWLTFCQSYLSFVTGKPFVLKVHGQPRQFPENSCKFAHSRCLVRVFATKPAWQSDDEGAEFREVIVLMLSNQRRNVCRRRAHIGTRCDRLPRPRQQ